jgi:hypothetical protein
MGNDPGNLIDEDGGCAGCTVTSAFEKTVSSSGLTDIVLTFKRATAVTSSAGSSLVKSTVSLAGSALSIGKSVADATYLNNLKAPATREEVIWLSKSNPASPANSFFNPPDGETSADYPLLAGAQWLGNWLWEESGAKDVELYVKNRISGFTAGNVVQDAYVVFQAGTILGTTKVKAPVVRAVKTSTSLVKTGAQWSKHSLQRLAERGVTKDMAEMAISKGQKFYDPLNKSINYVLPNGYASGKSLLVGTNPLTGEVTTVIRSSKNLINKRFIPIK